jgi:DNA-directed RNA polymerase subunit beta'
MAYQQAELKLHTFVWVKHSGLMDYQIEDMREKKIGNITHYTSPYLQVKKDIDGNVLAQYIRTTPGRILLNDAFQ